MHGHDGTSLVNMNVEAGTVVVTSKGSALVATTILDFFYLGFTESQSSLVVSTVKTWAAWMLDASEMGSKIISTVVVTVKHINIHRCTAY